MNSITLTATPASEANSLESTGLRVDGYDTLTQPIPEGKLGATSGEVRFKWTPRHGAGDARKFAITEVWIAKIYKNNDGYIDMYWARDSNISLRIKEGGVLSSNTWAYASIVAGTTYIVTLKYTATQITMAIDGVIKATITTPIDFGANIPDMAYWGIGNWGIYQADATFAAP